MKLNFVTILLAMLAGSLVTYIAISSLSAPEASLDPAPATVLPNSVATPGEREPLSLASIRSLAGTFNKRVALHQLIAAQNALQLRALILAIREEYTGNLQYTALNIALVRLVELDANVAMQTLYDLPQPIPAELIRSTFQAIAHSDRTLAIKQALSAPRHIQQIAGETLMEVIADLSDDERHQLVALLPDAAADARGQDWAARLNAALSTSNLATRQMEVYQTIISWANKDPQAAMAAASNLATNIRQIARMQVVAVWLQQDAPAAIAWVESLPPSRERQTLITAAVPFLARSDLQRALSYANELPVTEQMQAKASIAHIWYREDEAAFREWLEGTIGTASAGGTAGTNARGVPGLSILAMNLAQQDQALLDIIIEIVPEEQAKGIRAMARAVRTQTDPESVANEISAMENGPEKKAAGRNLIHSWSNQNTDGPIAWIAQQDSSEHPELYKALVNNWSQWDEQAAEDFARGIDDPIARDTALVTVYGRTANIDGVRDIFNDPPSESVRHEAGRQLFMLHTQTNSGEAAKYQEFVRGRSTNAEVRTVRSSP